MPDYVVTLGCFLVIQTVAATWWAATVTLNIKYIRENFDQFKDEAKKEMVQFERELRELRHQRINGN